MDKDKINLDELVNRAESQLEYCNKEISRKHSIISDFRVKIRNIYSEINQLESQIKTIEFLVGGKELRRQSVIRRQISHK